MDWLRRLISFSGRARRRTYWFTTLPCTIVMATGLGLLLIGEEQGLEAAVLAGVLVTLAPLLPILAVTVRRLHDRGRSAWWLALYMGLPMLFGGGGGEPAIVPLPSPLDAAMALLSAGLSVWALVDLGFLKGAPGENRFGPNPKTPVAEVFA